MNDIIKPGLLKYINIHNSLNQLLNKNFLLSTFPLLTFYKVGITENKNVLPDIRKDYQYYSGKSSDVARQLSLAGIALIWIFKVEKAGPLAVPEALHLPAILFVVSLGLDLLQYVFSTAIWGIFSYYHEQNGMKDDMELEAPNFFNWPSLAFFWGKLLTVLFAYAVLLDYIFLLKRIT